jgi:hypothetical protein
LLGIAALGITLYLLTWTAQTNYDRYFNVQLKRFDAWAQYATDATFVAKEIQALGPENHEFRVTAVLNGAPTIRFLNPDLEAAGTAQRFDWSIDVPANTGTSTVYLLDARKKAFFEWIQGLYPGAEYKALDPPKRDGEQIAFEAVISEDLVRAYMGIDGVYTPSGGEPVRQREASLSLDWSTEPPVAPPFDAVWTGSLRIERYNYHRLALAVPGSARLFLDGELVAEGSGSLGLASYLYKGDHDLRIEARIERAGVVEMTLNGTVAEPRSFLSYPSSGHGLVGTFYRGENAEGEPALVTLDPFLGIRYHSELDSVARPFTAVWRGFLDVPASGDYRFELDAHDEGELSIDGAVVPAVPGGTLSFPLDAGRHPIEVRLRNSTGGAVIFLWWVTPGSTEREVIPTERFTPR